MPSNSFNATVIISKKNLKILTTLETGFSPNCIYYKKIHALQFLYNLKGLQRREMQESLDCHLSEIEHWNVVIHFLVT